MKTFAVALGVLLASLADPALLMRAREMSEAGRYAEARALLDAFLDREEEGGRAAYAYFLRARAALALEDTASAVADFEKASQAAPASSIADDALYYAATYAARGGWTERARKLYQYALERYPASDFRRALLEGVTALPPPPVLTESIAEEEAPAGERPPPITRTALETLPPLPPPGEIRRAEPRREVQPGERTVTIRFEDAPIRSFVEWVAKTTGKNFVVDPEVTGEVTVYGGRPIPLEQILDLFYEILASRGLAVVPGEGGADRIAPRARAAQAVLPERGPFVTRLYRPRVADAGAVQSILRPLASGEDQMLLHAPTNTLILTGPSDNVARLIEIAEALDFPNARVEYLPLFRADAPIVAKRLNEVAGALPRKSGEGAPQVIADPPTNELILIGETRTLGVLHDVARELDASTERRVRVFSLEHARAVQLVEALSSLFASPTQGEAGRTRFFADPRTNALVIVTSFPPDLEELEGLVRVLDVPSAPVNAEVRVVRLDHADAEEIATALKAVLAAPGGEGGEAALLGPVRITADKPRNAVLVTSRPEDWMRIEALIEDLDRPQPQVLVEAVILEVTLSQLRSLGIELNTLDQPQAGRRTAVAGSNFGLRANVLAGSASGLVAGVFEGTTLGPVLNALLSDADVDVLSMPSVLATDNTEASIVVGDLIPIVTSQVSTDLQIQGTSGVQQNIDYRNVGVELRMTPHVGLAEQITMDLEVKVESVRREAVPNSALQLPSFTTRQLTTRAVVSDGDYIVLGGLISDRRERRRNRVPVLGDLPIVGHLFRSESNDKDKTTLLVFLRPRVLTGSTRAAEVTQEAIERYELTTPEYQSTDDPNRLNTVVGEDGARSNRR